MRRTINCTLKQVTMHRSIKCIYISICCSIAIGSSANAQTPNSKNNLSAAVIVSDTCFGNFILSKWGDFNFKAGKNSLIKTRTLETKGQIILNEGYNATITASEQIHLAPGFSVTVGSRLSAYIDPVNCAEKPITSKYGNGRLVYAAANLFPNPNNGVFFIALSPKVFSLPYNITVISADGRIIEQQKGQTGSLIRLNLQQYGKGVYFVQILYLSNGVTEILKAITQ